MQSRGSVKPRAMSNSSNPAYARRSLLSIKVSGVTSLIEALSGSFTIYLQKWLTKSMPNMIAMMTK